MEEVTVTHPVIEEVIALSSKATWASVVIWCDANLPALNQKRRSPQSGAFLLQSVYGR